jgi:UDP-N-acetylmuramyl pentapeptide phosphotransferase/UDP-N-acetylglucosamine-1-phosphate transferase
MEFLGGTFRIVITLFYLFVAWKYGDWKNKKKIYPSILFYICISFSISYITHDFLLWEYKNPFLKSHKLTDIFLTLITFPSMVFIYFSFFPFKSSFFKQSLFILGSIFVLSFIEGIFHLLNMIDYSNGWNFGWSIIVWCFLFISLRIHYSKPFFAWLIAIACTVFLILYFDIPVFD